MQIKWLAVVAVLAAVSAAPAAAQEPAAVPDFGALSDAELGERLEALETEGFSDACRSKVPLFAELARRNRGEARIEAGHLVAQAFCASERGRDDEGLRFLKKAEVLAPELGLDILGLYFATSQDDGAEAATRLRALAKADDLVGVEANVLYAALQDIRNDRLDAGEVAYDVSRAASFREMEPTAQAAVASAAIAYAAKTGGPSEVDELLTYVRSPYEVLTLLASRQYEPAWPAIERHAGENLAKVTASYAAWTATRLADEPEDRDRLGDHAYALLFAGRYEEAAALASDWLGPLQGGRTLEEGDAWALNMQVLALDALGRLDEADRIFDDLATLPADANPWVVNFVINRQGRLTMQGRWAESLVAGELARSVTEVHGSPYAHMLVAYYHACTFHKLGRAIEAERELAFVREHFADAPFHAGAALLCVEQPDQAAEILGRSLRETVVPDSLLLDLQDERFELFWSPSVLPSSRDLVFQRQDLREAALKHIRLLPDALVPVSSLRRQELAERTGSS